MRVCAASLFTAAYTLIGCDDNGSPHLKDRPDYSYSPYDTHAAYPESSISPSPPWTNESLSISGSVVPGKLYAEVFEAKRAGPNAVVYSDSCMNPQFRLGNKHYFLGSPFAYGSGSRLFLTHNKWYVLKMQDLPIRDHREMYWREQAAMSQARHTGVVSIIEPEADLSSMSSECQSRSFVMRKVQGQDLFGYVGLSTDRVMELGKHALRILEKFHDTGLIHGDIHLGNMILGSAFDMEKTLKLIDFGRSMLYIDPISQTHKSQSEMRQFTSLDSLNLDVLSINELEGRGVSRADDVFRLAEVLIMFCTKSMRNFGDMSPRRVAEIKRNRTFDRRVPRKLQALYRYAANLGFDEKPNYLFFD